MNEVWELDLGHAQQAVLLALADHANDEGGDVFPSLLRVAWKTGYSERQVRRIVRDLQKAGVLIEVAEATRYKPIEYRIDTSAATKKPPFSVYREAVKAAESRGDKSSPLPRADISDLQGGQSDPPGRTSSVGRGDTTVSPEPSTEPSQGTETTDPSGSPPTPPQAGGQRPDPPAGGRKREWAAYRQQDAEWLAANAPHPSLPSDVEKRVSWWAPRAAAMREAMKERPSYYAIWIEPLHPHAIVDGTLYLGAPDDYPQPAGTVASLLTRALGMPWEIVTCTITLTKETHDSTDTGGAAG